MGADTLTPQELLTEFKGLVTDLCDNHKKALEKKADKGEVPSEFLEKIEKLSARLGEVTTAYNDQKAIVDDVKKKNDELATKLNRRGAGMPEDEYKYATIGEEFTDSKEFKEFMQYRRQDSRGSTTGSVRIPDIYSFGKKDIVTSNQGGTLIRNERRPGILQQPNLPLTIRALLPVGRTNSNMVEYVKEGTQTNNAGPQYSPASPTNVFDGAKKNKSDLAYTLATAPIRTLAHYMKASKQILDDVPQLQSEINNRLLYFLALEEEEEILKGDGTAGQLLGIIPQATAYDTSLNASGDTKIDKVRHALLQVTLSRYMADAIVLHPKDWHDIELVKTGEGTSANTGAYLMSNPTSTAPQRLWGQPVLPSLNMTAGDFLVGNFALGAQIFDRMEPGVQIANQNEDDFVRNMITILAEERVGLAVYQALAFVEGTF
jgi:HK97 family phage major capsid protein